MAERKFIRTEKISLKLFLLINIFVLFIIPFVSGEVYLWNSVSKDYSKNTVRETASYWFSDTSENGIGRNKNINILLWSEVEQLPFNFSGVYPVSVDWCNYTIVHDINVYDTDGNLINMSSETTILNFQNQPFNSTQLTFQLRSRDSLRVIMECHYTDPTYLYVENILVGRFYTYFPSFECDGCEEYTLEEITHQTEIQEQITESQLSVYNKIQKVVEWNWGIWLILGWIIRIVFIFIALILLFSGIYYFYKLFDNIAKEI